MTSPVETKQQYNGHDASETTMPHVGIVSLFGDLAEAVLEKATRLALEEGAVLFRQGDPGDCAYIVLEGELDVVVDMGFGPVRTAYATTDELIGEIAVFAQVPRKAT